MEFNILVYAFALVIYVAHVCLFLLSFVMDKGQMFMKSSVLKPPFTCQQPRITVDCTSNMAASEKTSNYNLAQIWG